MSKFMVQNLVLISLIKFVRNLNESKINKQIIQHITSETSNGLNSNRRKKC